MSQPLVSVVTPFHNTAAYLAECIESVLAQTYSNFEYILVDNCSTDGSTEIAERYAGRDPRIRLIRRATLLSQVQNYNGALTEISGDSKYCKMVQADDFIFPDCLNLMVQAFEQSETIGLVSAYDLKGGVVRGSGIPYQTTPFSGKEIARLYLRESVFPFGSPTTVMYRSSLIRERRPFYDESLLHEDTEACMQILADWDFGFVYQVLSFLRVDNESISGAFLTYQPIPLDRYITVRRYASKFLEPDEAVILREQTKRWYYDVLAQESFHFRAADFWRYHLAGLKTLGETLDRPYLTQRIARRLLSMIANPVATAARGIRHLQDRQGKNVAKLTRTPEKSTPVSSQDTVEACANVSRGKVDA